MSEVRAQGHERRWSGASGPSAGPYPLQPPVSTLAPALETPFSLSPPQAPSWPGPVRLPPPPPIQSDGMFLAELSRRKTWALGCDVPTCALRTTLKTMYNAVSSQPETEGKPCQDNVGAATCGTMCPIDFRPVVFTQRPVSSTFALCCLPLSL